MSDTETPPPKKSNRPLKVAITIALAVVFAAIVIVRTGVLAPLIDRITGNDDESALRQVEELPLIRLVVRENPSVDAEFRKAIAAERQSPTKDGPNRMFLVGAEMRKKYIVPALANTDDPHALAAVKLLQDFTLHLQKTNPAICFEFGKVGLLHPEKIDREAAELFRRALAAQEEAYQNGKSASAARPKPADDELGRALIEAGYTAADFQQLTSYAMLSEADGCAVTVKLYSAAARLPPERGALVARYLLTVAQ